MIERLEVGIHAGKAAMSIIADVTRQAFALGSFACEPVERWSDLGENEVLRWNHVWSHPRKGVGPELNAREFFFEHIFSLFHNSEIFMSVSEWVSEWASE